MTFGFVCVYGLWLVCLVTCCVCCLLLWVLDLCYGFAVDLIRFV